MNMKSVIENKLAIATIHLQWARARYEIDSSKTNMDNWVARWREWNDIRKKLAEFCPVA